MRQQRRVGRSHHLGEGRLKTCAMSDEEMPMAGDMGMGGMSDSDDGMGGDVPASTALPEGVAKEIVTEADGANWKTPKKGDEVTVHYVGTLASDGSEFDSSRGRGQPFVFTLGKGQVIKGWDVGVATMKKGEIAKFTLALEFAYGESGSPPKIPGNATLVFEIELISWASKDDLFGDEGVVKTLVKEGSGWKSPKMGDEVLLSVRAVAVDGSVIEEHVALEYVVGSGAMGSIGRACDKAIVGMKKGEECEIKCSKGYAYGEAYPEGATVSLTLSEIFETKDVSVLKDGAVRKKQIKEGEGWDTPKDCSKVKLLVEAATDGSAPIVGFASQTLEFLVGNGEVCDALEYAVAEMKKGERAVITVGSAALAAEERLGMAEVKAERVVMTLTLEDFEKAKDTWSMSEEEKLEWGTARKEAGSSLLKAGRLGMALQRYRKVIEAFGYVDSMQEENKQKAKALKMACELNKAAVCLKLKDFVEARAACNTVLKEDAQNSKALYRRAQAELGLKNFFECIGDCRKVMELEAQSREARALLKQAQVGQREEDRKAKGLFANMCKALGTGPIPPPGKRERLGNFSDEESMDEGASPEDGKTEGAVPEAAGAAKDAMMSEAAEGTAQAAAAA